MKRLIILFILFSFVFVGCTTDTTPEPNDVGDARIEGADNKTIENGEMFFPLTGVKAYDYNNRDLTSDITVSGTVDIYTANDYTLTYKVTGESGNEVTVTRVITVLPEPVNDATISGLSNKYLFIGQSFDSLSGVTASDHDGTDLTESITIEGEVDTDTAAVYTLTYKVTGESGNEVSYDRIITVQPNKPKISVPFPKFEIYQGEDIDLYFCLSATSETDGDISSSIYIKDDGGFDKDVIGTYVITYGVKDSTGLEGTNKRTITVNP